MTQARAYIISAAGAEAVTTAHGEEGGGLPTQQHAQTLCLEGHRPAAGTGDQLGHDFTVEEASNGEHLARGMCKWAGSDFESGKQWEAAGRAALDSRLWSGVRVRH